MIHYMCTYAIDRENVVVFEFTMDIHDMEEAIGQALYQISVDDPAVDLTNLVALSVLRLE